VHSHHPLVAPKWSLLLHDVICSERVAGAVHSHHSPSPLPRQRRIVPSAAAWHYLQQACYNALLMGGKPLKWPFLLGICTPHVIHSSLGLPESSSKTACRSVQPFLHNSPQSVPLLYNVPICSPKKNSPSPWGLGPPSDTRYLRPTRVIMPNGMLIVSAVFVWVPNAMLYNALSMGKKTQNCPFLLGFCHPPGGGPSHGHRQHAQKIR